MNGIRFDNNICYNLNASESINLAQRDTSYRSRYAISSRVLFCFGQQSHTKKTGKILGRRMRLLYHLADVLNALQISWFHRTCMSRSTAELFLLVFFLICFRERTYFRKNKCIIFLKSFSFSKRSILKQYNTIQIKYDILIFNK